MLAGGRNSIRRCRRPGLLLRGSGPCRAGHERPRTRIQLLTSALADTPARDDARIPLFQAVAAMRSDEFARGVIEPLLRQQFLRPVPATASRENEIFDSETGLYAELPGELNAQLKIPIAQQAQVAWQLGEVLVRLDRLNEALPYMRLAYKLEKAPDRRKQIAGRITSVRAQVRRQQLNAARQPILHEALEQDRLVRPRLLARSVAPANPAPSNGGVKQ